MLTKTKERRLLKWIQTDINRHLTEADKLYKSGSFAAGKWEDGYVMALSNVRGILKAEPETAEGGR